MSNKDISYLQTLCGISDDYVDSLENLSREELRDEHREVFGDNSHERVGGVKSLFNKVLSSRKKEIASHLVNANHEEQTNKDIVGAVLKKYGSLKSFFAKGFLNNANMPSGLTLQYRNMTDITDEDIELLIEALHEHGDLQIEEDDF